MTVPEAFELLRAASIFEERLLCAREELAAHSYLVRELGWIDMAAALLSEGARERQALEERAEALPELEQTRQAGAALSLSRWLDALERAVAGITFHLGARDPLLEALFPHQRFAQLRRSKRPQLEEYAAELTRRLQSTYVIRMMTRAELDFAQPVLEEAERALARWRAHFEARELTEEARAALRRDLLLAAERVALSLRQSRSLAEAAMAPLPERFEAHGLAARALKGGKGRAASELEAIAARRLAPPL